MALLRPVYKALHRLQATLPCPWAFSSQWLLLEQVSLRCR
jgi:hypothetical protein